MSKKYVSPASFIIPININGLDGRMLSMKADNRHSKSETLIIYGLRSNLERWWGLATALKQYTGVTMVDLPGMGGMDSFYTIGVKPSIDNFADYVASFIKLRYKKKKLSIIGIGFGFVVVTRMLQRNPDIISKVKIVVCINGYARHDDIKMSKTHKAIDTMESYMLALPSVPFLAKKIAYNSLALSYKYDKLSNTKVSDRFLLKFQIDLDKETDLRTSKYIIRELAKLDNCTSQINLPLWHVTLGDEKRNLKPRVVEQHLRIVFKNYHFAPSKMIKKVPLVMNDEKTGRKVLPSAVRRELKKPSR